MDSTVFNLLHSCCEELTEQADTYLREDPGEILHFEIERSLLTINLRRLIMRFLQYYSVGDPEKDVAVVVG